MTTVDPPSLAGRPAVVAAFDELADGYDRSFTDTVLGRRYRAATWRRFDTCFPPGARVLELGCGTGEDAVELGRRGVEVLATDGAEAMVRAARAKVTTAGLAGRVGVRRLAIEDLASGRDADGSPLGTGFDGVLSNFGALNCVEDLAAAARAVAELLRPGGVAAVCVMGRLVPWEWAWFLAHGQPGQAARRLHRAPSWRGVTLRYPSPRALRRAFAPAFAARRTWALGALLPPPAAEGWAARRPRLIDTLDHLERRGETLPPLAWLADHYIVEFVRR